MANRILRLLILVALILFVVSFVVFWFGGPSFSDADVVLTLEAPHEASAGDEVTYLVTYENHTQLVLKNLHFRFSFPTSATVIDDSGGFSSDPSSFFDVDSLAAGEKGEHTFRVFLVGERGDIKTAGIEMDFEAGTLRSSFQKSATASTTLTYAPFVLTLVAPPNAVDGQSVSYRLDYRNESGDTLSDARITFQFPDGFTAAQESPSPSAGQNQWSLPPLDNGRGGRITVTGALRGSEGEEKAVTVLVERKVGEDFIQYARSSSSTYIISPFLGTSVSVNGTREYTATLGDTLRYGVTYRNDSNFTLRGMTLAVRLDGEMYDFSSLIVRGGFFDSSTDTITWNAGGVPAFGDFGPNQSGKVDFQITLKENFPSGGAGSRNFLVKATAEFATPNVPQNLDEQELSAADSIVTQISTQPVFDQMVYYKDPNFGSQGPLPPQVDQTTVFTVHWRIANPGNGMEGTKIVATLPAGVVWGSAVSAGPGQPQPTFDVSRSQVTWDLGLLPTNPQGAATQREATFRIAVTPSVNQRGQIIQLLKGVQMAGKDTFTKQDINLSKIDMTTDDLADRPQEGRVE